MSASDRLPLNAGMPPPPCSTWSCTFGASGFSWSRFGPTCPEVPASLSVWQPAQLATNTALPAVGFPAGPIAVEPAIVEAAVGAGVLDVAALEVGAVDAAGAADAAGAPVDVLSPLLEPPQAAAATLHTAASRMVVSARLVTGGFSLVLGPS